MDLAIVNRGFWEDDSNKVIGEALADLSERASADYQVCVITQSKGALGERLNRAGRCRKVKLFACRSLTSSVNSFLSRSLDALFFSIYTFWSLFRARPKHIYVATDPPVVVPFIVFLYSLMSSARYYYHLQDIHPEASSIVVKMPRPVFAIMRFVDSFTIRRATKIITLTHDMAVHINGDIGYKGDIEFVENPSGFSVASQEFKKNKDFVFCGNIGRLQRIPLLVEAIRKYHDAGGECNFTFIGAGANAQMLAEADRDIPGLTYVGPLPPHEASQIISQHRWALLPIDDEVTKYAFPSKTSTYLLSGCKVLAICGAETSVGRWVDRGGYGMVCEPDVDAVVNCFFRIQDSHSSSDTGRVPQDLAEKYSYQRFSDSLVDIMLKRA